jgi:hypothetical protein
LSAVLVAGALIVGAALDGRHDPCYEAYLQSGLVAQQMGFEEFRDLYADTFCAPGGDGPVAERGSGTLGGTR